MPAEGTRFCVVDSLYALLTVYLMQSSRDLSLFNPSVAESDRKVTVDGQDFKIVRRVTGQIHEEPGINLVSHDEIELEDRNPSECQLNVLIHIYVTRTTNPVADDRTVNKLQSLVDRALKIGGLEIIDFTGVQAVSLNKAAYWFRSPLKMWQQLTDVNSDSYLHVAKVFNVQYRGEVVSF